MQVQKQQNWMWNNGLVPNWEGITSRLILSCLFNFYAEYILSNAGLDEVQAGTKIAGRNINNLRYADDTTLMVESEEELKSLLMNMKEESEKAVLKLNIQKTKIMTSSLITSWQIDGQSVDTVSLFSWAPKRLQMVTVAMKLKDACSLEESYDQPREHIKKQSFALPTKVHIVKAMVFPVVMYGCESWTIRKAEC